jgi:Family of unknown function (DUF6270)
MSVAIFGSCVTRDLFEDPLLRAELGHYAARSSIISVVAPPAAIDEERVLLSSAWQRRCVVGDFRKSFFDVLAQTEAEWLVIDLIDERFDLLQGAETFITCSSAFRSAGLEERPPFPVEVIRRNSPAGWKLFEDAAVRFAERVTRIIPPERVVLHRALWCTHYRADGRVEPFPPGRLELSKTQNAMLNHGYDALTAVFGGAAETIGVDPARHLADAAHHWQLEPYHYEPTYNEWAIERLQQLLGLRSDSGQGTSTALIA